MAHDAIHQAVGEGPWNAAVAAVVEGMKAERPADGIVRRSKFAARRWPQHFPPDGPAKNHLPNTVLET